ncbi:MAG TPA: hypothetical protein VGE52_15635, partial [Pirellulales bacterium]
VRFAAAIAWACLAPKKLSSSAAMILEAGCRPEHDFLSRLPREERYVAAAVQRATKAPQVGRLILLALLNSPTEEVRNTAMLQLLETPDCPPEAIAKLTTLLKDGSVATRQWAAFRIASALDEPIIRARERGRFAASEKLARQLEELARPFVAALTAQLAVEDDPGARLAMCHALKHLALWGAPAAAVLKSLENVEHNARAALWVMEVLHHGSPVELVERFNERGRIAWMAERVLLRKAQSQPQPIVAALSDGLESPAADWIAAVLGHLGPVAASAVPALQRALNHRESTVRKAAAAALARIDPRVASGPLQLDEKTIRESLGAIVPPELPKLIGRLLNDANVNEQYAALRAIAELGSAALPARSYLLAATEKGWLYYNAFGALSRVEPELVRPRMRELMSFYRSDDRRKFPTQPDAFVQYLGPELQADAIELLLECLATTDETATAGRLAMVAAVSGLRLADPRLLQPLIERLLRLDWRGERKRGIDPRSQILHCLNREGVRFSALVPVVGEFVGDAQLGPLAMETLSRMGSWTDVLPFIEPFLATTDQERRKASDQAVARLGRLATADQLPSLEAALTHESVVVSRAARAAAKRLKDVE